MYLRNKLSVKQIATLTKPGIYSDGGGLYLRTRPSGTRSWLYVYMMDGKRRELGLGSVLDVSLAQAREKARSARQLHLDGVDPIVERRRVSKPKQKLMTFGEMATALIDDIEKGFDNKKHRDQWRSSISRYAEPILTLPVEEVDTDAIVALLKPIWLAKSETARRVRGRIERVLDAAKAKGLRSGENPARLRGHLDLLLPRQPKKGQKHHAAMPFAELPDFMIKLSQRPAAAAKALQMTILTAARTSEVLGMTWDEIDFENRIWSIPASRMKAKNMHQVPLSETAMRILRDIKANSTTNSMMVFQGTSGGGLSNMAMTMLLRRMDQLNITVHGFRSTFRDWAGEKTSHAREDIEMALAHTIASKTERAYRRGTAIEKRRRLMSDFATFCSS
jgi:integrase